jgi:hypothetical protein
MKLKVWVEVMTVQRITEDIVEVPDEKWAAMTEVEREQYKSSIYEDLASQVANGGCEEIDEED